MNFYSFDYIGHKKAMNLKIKYDLSCEIVNHIDYDNKGNIYYLDEQSRLFKL